MTTRIMPEQSYLRECFDYNPETGLVTWRSRPIGHFVSVGAWKRWNTMYSGKSAVSSSHAFGHQQVCLMDQNWPAHRLIWKWMTGEDPAQVDHRRDATNNSWDNLRASNSYGNNRNRRAIRTKAVPFKGVVRVSGSLRFAASIRINGKPTWLGTFSTPEEAHIAYCDAAKKHFGEFWNPG